MALGSEPKACARRWGRLELKAHSDHQSGIAHQFMAKLSDASVLQHDHGQYRLQHRLNRPVLSSFAIAVTTNFAAHLSEVNLG